MSNGRPFRRQLVDLLGPLDGERIPGGCAECDAYQTVAALEAGVWTVNVHHDRDCPALAAMEAQQ
ncbi:MAG: hypothetical protein ACLGI8_09510 [Acidimicrobiia bacterium]